MRQPRLRIARLVSLAVCAAVLSVQPAFASDLKTASDCMRLTDLRLPGATVLSAELHEAGAFKGPDGKPFPNQVAFCRVVGRATPSSDSDIRFEVWLPVAWNGRLWGVGNGDFAGSISQRALNARMADGYAAVGTDTGHRTDNAADTRWAVGHPQQVVDFAHRGIHEAAVAAKRVVSAFYGRPPAHAYFGSCSNGGRQALMEAQRYPDDYDGIVAGAPAHEWTSIYIGAGDWQFRQLADPARRVPAAKLPALRAAVAAACHAGADGVVDEPQRCAFDPAVLACRGAETDQCLTPPQLQTVRGLYAGNASARGQPLLRGYAVGSEATLDDVHYRSGTGSDDMFLEVLGFWRDLVFEDPAWDWRSYDMARDGALATKKLAGVLDADSTDIGRFAARGGKLIVYQGWIDPLVPPAGTIDYVERVERTMGAERARAAVRLFMAPGVGHCGGGDAPNQFGQFAAGAGDPEASLGAALQRWVEQGTAPEQVVARKHENDDPAGKVVRSRPLCAWPRVARYTGTGSIDAASSFECRAPG